MPWYLHCRNCEAKMFEVDRWKMKTGETVKSKHFKNLDGSKVESRTKIVCPECKAWASCIMLQDIKEEK